MNRFPFGPPFVYEGQSWDVDFVLEKWGQQITPRRRERIAQVVEGRTFNISLCLEKIYDVGNLNAVIRTAENFGIGSMHIIESEKTKYSDRITKGAHKWVEVYKYNHTLDCIHSLKSQGYRIISTHLSAKSVPITSLDWDTPSVLCFGNEREGIGQELLKASDVNTVIPTSGFTESFNISVAAALALGSIFLGGSRGTLGDLTLEEKKMLTAAYYLRTLPKFVDALKKMGASAQTSPRGQEG